jgi:hypothetical protein
VVGCAGSSVVEDRKAQLVEVRGVGDRVDSDDLAVPDRETEDEEQLFSLSSNERDSTSSTGHILSSRSVIVVTKETHPM